MLASFPASMLNQNTPDLGILNRLKLDPSRSRDVKSGVPAYSISTLRLPAEEVGRPVAAMFNTERIVARAWPASENHIAIAELTY